MKRKLILFAILLFALCLVTAVACADISNVQFKQERNGSITVTWSDSDNNAPYQVTWSMENWSKLYYHEDSYSGTSASLMRLVPGGTYEIRISNSTSSVMVPYTVPKGTFTDWKSGKRIIHDIGDFDVQVNSIYRTFHLELHYPRLGKARRYTLLFALNTPNGYTHYTWLDDNFKMEPRYAYYYWDLDLSDWIDSVSEDYNGKIPSGIYRLEAYLNGQFYANYNFYMYGN